VRIVSSAPTRIDLAGGTYDIWPLYLFHDRAQTINAAISLRAHCTISARADRRVTLTSDDTGEQVDAPDASALDVDRLPLVARLVKHFEVAGVDVRTKSESPVGAGIAGSSAMNVALIGALSRWTGRNLSDADLLTLAMNVEAQVIDVPTGVQDYRPALFGGVSAVELGVDGVKRAALNVDVGELEQRLVLAYTGATRNSGINNWDVMVRRINRDANVTAAFDAIRTAALAVRGALESSDWPAVATSLHQEWIARKRLAPGVTTPEIENLMSLARGAGSQAAKVCGAGGGGCLVCFVDPDRRDEVGSALAGAGARVLPFRIERDGLRVEEERESTKYEVQSTKVKEVVRKDEGNRT